MNALVVYKTYKIVCENGVFRLYNSGLECFNSSNLRAVLDALHAIVFDTDALKAAT